MSDDRLADWKLVIVGSGSDENNYKVMWLKMI